MRSLPVLVAAMGVALGAPAAIAAAQPPAATNLAQYPLTASVTQDSGLEKHLFSFPLPEGPQVMVGLTGTTSFTTTLNYFGEALISVDSMPGPGCAAVNGTSYASYSDPGFPVLNHLVSFIFKSSRAQKQTQTANISLPYGIPVSSCIVVVLDGGGAWGPKHGYGYPVTMTSALTLTTLPVPPGQDFGVMDVAVGGEFLFGSNDLPNGSGLVTVLRVNPQGRTPVALDALFGSISASGFDGSSGELVPQGPWGARIATFLYPSLACGNDFPVNTPFEGLLHFFRMPVGTQALPAGAQQVYVASLQGSGLWPQQTSYFKPTWPATMQPGDCLVTVHRSGASGVIDLEDQSTAVMRPLP